MKRYRLPVITIVAAFLVPLSCAQEKTPSKPLKAVRLGKLWDGKGKLWTNAVVVVEGDRIKTVTSDASAMPSGAEVIDLSKYTGLPGLIDVHTHMTIFSEDHFPII